MSVAPVTLDAPPANYEDEMDIDRIEYLCKHHLQREHHKSFRS